MKEAKVVDPHQAEASGDFGDERRSDPHVGLVPCSH